MTHSPTISGLYSATVIKLVDSPALVDDLPVASRWFSAHVDCGVTVFVITILPGIQSTGELI